MKLFKFFKLLLITIVSCYLATSFTFKEGNIATEVVRICHFPTTVFAQGDPGECGEYDIPVVFNEECEGFVEMTINAINLTPSTQTPGIFNLPGDMPDLYVEYDSNGDGILDSNIGPVTDFSEASEMVQGLSGAWYKIYESFITLTIVDIINEGCPDVSVYPSSLSLDLRIQSGDLYPIHSFAGIDRPFSCDIFHETCADCFPATQKCVSLPPTYQPGLCIYCDDCPNTTSGNSLIDYSSEENNISANNLEIKPETLSVNSGWAPKISPNPFQDEIIVQYTLATNEEVQITITSLEGKVMWENVFMEEAGEQVKNLQPETLPNGLYFLTIKIAEQQESIKIYKIE